MSKGVVGPGLLLIEKTRKSALCRCIYKGSTFSSVFELPCLLVQPGFESGFELAASRSADRRLSN